MLEMMSEDMGAMGHTRFQAIHSTLLTSSIRCSSCGHTTEPHQSAERTLSVPLESGLSGSNLEIFVAAFLRDKISGYRCEGCQKAVNVIRDVKIASPADVITVQLKRAGWNGTVKTKVGITRVLDLTKHAVDCSTQLRYELVSSVSHQGNTASGHYIAHAIGPDGRWTEFNDETTHRVSPKAVLAPPGFKPVLLYYKRV
jgi:ubiquitin C-terminal hydrolase